MQNLYGKIEQLEDAKKAAQHGAIAGLAFAAMYLGGLIWMEWTGLTVASNRPVSPLYLFLQLAITVAILLLVWRVWRGTGLVSAIILFATFLFEIYFKIANGVTDSLFLVAYLLIAQGLFEGIRGTIAYRRMTSN